MSARRGTNSNRRGPSGGTGTSGGALTGARVRLFADVGITDSSGVSAWADQSGYGNDLAQATLAARPAVVASWRNGRAAIQGATGDSLARATLTTGDLAQATTHYYVLETQPAMVGAQQFADGASAPRQTVYMSGSSGYMFAGAGGATAVATSIPAATPVIWRAVFNGASSTSRIEPHGAAVITGASDTSTQALRGLTLLTDYLGGNAFLGKFAACLIFPGVPAADDTRLAFLRSYYNIVSL